MFHLPENCAELSFAAFTQSILVTDLGSRQHILWVGTMVSSQCNKTEECKQTTHSQMCSHCVSLELSLPDKQFSTHISKVITKGILIFQKKTEVKEYYVSDGL